MSAIIENLVSTVWGYIKKYVLGLLFFFLEEHKLYEFSVTTQGITSLC